MKIVNFKRAGMENFCNHIDPIEILFENNKLSTITGPNGVGKTAIFQSIPYTLYGACEKGKGEDVLNDITQKNCHTFVEFEINSDLYRVDRYVKYEKIGTTVLISKNNATPYKKGHKEVVPEVEKLLIPHSLFTNTLLFSQKVKTFFTDLKDSEQKEIFRKIMTIEEFVSYFKRTGVKRSELTTKKEEEIIEIKIIEKVISEAHESLKTQFDLKKKFEVEKINSIEVLTKNKILTMNAVEDEKKKLEMISKLNIASVLSEENSKYATITEKLNNINSVVENKIVAIDLRVRAKSGELETKSNEAKSKLEQERRESEDVKRKEFEIKKIELEKSCNDEIKIIGELNSQIATKKTAIEFLKKELQMYTIPNAKVCPVCFQDITEECIKNFTDKKNKIAININDLEESIKELGETLSSATWRESHAKGIIASLTLELNRGMLEIKDKFEAEVMNINLRLNDVKNQLQLLSRQEKEKVKLESENEQIALNLEKKECENKKADLEQIILKQKEIERNIQNYENSISNYVTQLENENSKVFDDSVIEGLNLKIRTKENSKLEIKENIKNLELQLSIIEFWHEGFSPRGIQSMLIDDAIPFMNERVSDYLGRLSNGRYTVSFDTMSETKGGEFRDKISVSVFDNITHANARVKLSGGQERIVDVATILTLSDLQSNIQDVTFNILLFDEIFDSLDDENINGVSKLLRMVSQGKSVWIISHRHIDSIESDEELMFH